MDTLLRWKIEPEVVYGYEAPPSPSTCSLANQRLGEAFASQTNFTSDIRHPKKYKKFPTFDTHSRITSVSYGYAPHRLTRRGRARSLAVENMQVVDPAGVPRGGDGSFLDFE
jgi:hypothetical protein